MKRIVNNLWIVLLVCGVIAIIVLTFFVDPIVRTVHQKEETVDESMDGEIVVFYQDEKAQYYFNSIQELYNTTVLYWNNQAEWVVDALEEGHITIEDLDRFGIEYGVRPKNH